MSAHLTVYSMAIAAERPLRLRAAEEERLAAQLDVASKRRSSRLLRHLGSTFRRSQGSGIAAEQWTGTSPREWSVIGQFAG
jgi:hypothetical protein